MKNCVLFSFLCVLVWTSAASAVSNVGEINRIDGDFAFITLGREEGLKPGLRGEVLREELLGGQIITIRVAHLKVEQVFDDSAKITILMKLSPVIIGDKVRVDNVNRPPVLAPIGIQTLSEESPWSYLLSAQDPDGDDLFFFVEELPVDASFDSQSGEFWWKPNKNQSGTYTIRFGVSDGMFQEVEDVTLTVLDFDGGVPKWVWYVVGGGAATAIAILWPRNGGDEGTMNVTVTINP